MDGWFFVYTFRPYQCNLLPFATSLGTPGLLEKESTSSVDSDLMCMCLSSELPDEDLASQ